MFEDKYDLRGNREKVLFGEIILERKWNLSIGIIHMMAIMDDYQTVFSILIHAQRVGNHTRKNCVKER